MILRALPFVLVGLFCAQNAFSQTPPPVSVGGAQDGVIAALAISGDKGALGWRFARAIDRPLERIDVFLNGTLLREEPVQPYPGPGDSTAIVALFDRGDANASERVEAEKRAIARFSEGLSRFHRLALATYAAEASLLAPAGDDPDALARLFRDVTAVDGPSNLSKALILSIGTVAQFPATRRAVFVFSDGHNDGSTPLPDLQALANAYGVSVNFIMFPSQRPADTTALKALAENTGGLLVESSETARFLQAPFQALDSGGYRPIDLASARKYFWQGASEVKAVLHYGDRRLELAQTFDPPSASTGDTISNLLAEYWAAGLAAVALACGAALGLARARRKARAPIVSRDAGPVATATLEDISDGAVYALTSSRIAIGRSVDNDIVVADDTVSRLHATIRDDNGALVLENASVNGTFVNHVAVDTAKLQDGDLISIGPKTYHLHISPVAERAHEEVTSAPGPAPAVAKDDRSNEIVRPA